MPLEAASFVWLTPEPLDQLTVVVSRLGAAGLLASKLELDEGQLDTLSKNPAVAPLLGEVKKAVSADDVAALVQALKAAGPAPGATLNVYFRLQQPAKLTGALREAFEQQLGAPPPEDKLGRAPIAPFEVWAAFALDDLHGTQVVAQSSRLKRQRVDGLGVPVWRVEQKPAAADALPLAEKHSLELRIVSDDAGYLVFALERAGVWTKDSTVLLRTV